CAKCLSNLRVSLMATLGRLTRVGWTQILESSQFSIVQDFFIPVQARRAGLVTQLRPSRPPTATIRRTTAGDVTAVAVFAPKASVIADAGADLAAEDPIGPTGIGEDERNQDRDSKEHEDLAVLGRSCLPDRDALRHDIGIHADAEANIRERKQCQRQEERPGVLPGGE